MTTRRNFLKASAAATASIPYLWTSRYAAAQDKNSRPVLAMIGCGGKGRDDAQLASAHGDFAAVCDVDRVRAEAFAANPRLNDNGRRKLDIYGDYRRLLQRPDIDAVICATPDHWHTPIYVDALRAGKHVYGEKPMTLTVDEVKVLRRAVAESNRTFQVGNQQRSCQWFREAIAIVKSGILGKGPLTAYCFVGKGRSGGPFKPVAPPPHLDWDFWLGQAPLVPYMPERCHRTFRYWFDYSGGTVTDWGAHHIDIAQWALGAIDTQPVQIEGEAVLDRRANCYSTAQTFRCTLTFANGNKIVVQDGGAKENGILFEGTKEHIFVNRGRMTGNLIGQLTRDARSLAKIREAAAGLYDGPYGLPDGNLTDYSAFSKAGPFAAWSYIKQSHMGNFFRAIELAARPISDVDTVGNATISCHLCNIAMRLDRKLVWDPAVEAFVGDDAANAMLAREQRKPYAIDA